MIALLLRFLAWVGTLGPVLKCLIAAGAFLLAFGSFFVSMWSKVIAGLDALIVPAVDGSADFSPLGLVNYVFPLDTLLTMLSAYMALKVACAGLRVVKSFVPTIS